MKIAINNLDSKRTNIAIEKVMKYHRQRGDTVESYSELNYNEYDKVYCFSLFDFTRKPGTRDKFIEGGTGYNIKKRLPPEIEKVKLYQNIGYLTRGCIRNCPFCVIPEKEGAMKRVNNIKDLWDGRRKRFRLLDNNILADKQHFIKNCEIARKYDFRLFFEQGLDYRLLDDEILWNMEKTKIVEPTFAWDSPGGKEKIKTAIDLLAQYDIPRQRWYVMVGYWTTKKQDLEKLYFLRKRVWSVYLLIYGQDQMAIPLRRWVNNKSSFHGLDFDEFLLREGTQKYIDYYEDIGVINNQSYLKNFERSIEPDQLTLF
jgi:hypothetical protein